MPWPVQPRRAVHRSRSYRPMSYCRNQPVSTSWRSGPQRSCAPPCLSTRRPRTCWSWWLPSPTIDQSTCTRARLRKPRATGAPRAPSNSPSSAHRTSSLNSVRPGPGNNSWWGSLQRLGMHSVVCWSTAVPNWPPKAVICSSSMRSAGVADSSPTRTRPWYSARMERSPRCRMGRSQYWRTSCSMRSESAVIIRTSDSSLGRPSPTVSEQHDRPFSRLPGVHVSRRLFTSASVTEGHPRKISDQISDGILDALLAADPKSRVAVETLITTGQVHVAGEVTTTGYVDIPEIVRNTVLDIGYDSSVEGFDGTSCGVSVSSDAQAPDIAQGVDTAYESRVEGDEDPLDKQGAGDQGLMFGYATDETPELMPMPIALAHRLSEQLSTARKSGAIPYLRPDGKTQVTIEYEGDRPVRLDTIVVSTQHAANVDLDNLLTPDIKAQVIKPILERFDRSEERRVGRAE